MREVYAEPEGELETLLAGIRELLGLERVVGATITSSNWAAIRCWR